MRSESFVFALIVFLCPVRFGKEREEERTDSLLSSGDRIQVEKRNECGGTKKSGEKNVSLMSPGCRAIIEAISRRSTERF